jgi:hypothetical protein
LIKCHLKWRGSLHNVAIIYTLCLVKFLNSKKRKNNGLERKKGSSAGTLGRVQNQVKSIDCKDRMGHARRGSCRGC